MSVLKAGYGASRGTLWPTIFRRTRPSEPLTGVNVFFSPPIAWKPMTWVSGSQKVRAAPLMPDRENAFPVGPFIVFLRPLKRSCLPRFHPLSPFELRAHLHRDISAGQSGAIDLKIRNGKPEKNSLPA
jgi:hypothetical protein